MRNDSWCDNGYVPLTSSHVLLTLISVIALAFPKSLFCCCVPYLIRCFKFQIFLPARTCSWLHHWISIHFVEFPQNAEENRIQSLRRSGWTSDAIGCFARWKSQLASANELLLQFWISPVAPILRRTKKGNSIPSPKESENKHFYLIQSE